MLSCDILSIYVVAGMDYNATSVPDPVVFPTNSTEGMELCAEIAITDDSALEGEHNFTVSISPTSPEITLGDPYRATIVIQDNDGKKYTAEEYNNCIICYSRIALRESYA